YFKFDSADLTAQAQALATHQEKPWVLVKYYGWRIRIFSMFPNAVKLKEVNRDYTHFPLFNLFFIAVLLASGFFIRRQLKMVVDRIRNRKTSDP
ncbi:MAG: DUF1523 family protein, partial [Deltaproteobacteria bacterium]|nr:DUF1523 family protein [Deltaproteobacteria bacterium]